MKLSEQLAAKKAAKQKRLLQQAEKKSLLSAQRKRDNVLKNDHIPMYEWRGSTYHQYLELMRDKITANKVVVDDLLEHFVQLHRFTFWECNYDFSNIREIVESLFNKYLSDYDLSNVEPIIRNHVSIHYKQRDLLLQFMNVIAADIFSYTSRIKFAETNAEMITSHNIWCNMTKPCIVKFIDKKCIAEAQEILRLKLNAKKIYEAARDKKVLIYTENGDIEELTKF